MQETKARAEQLSEELITPRGYQSFFSWPTLKKGYSGVAVYTKEKPIAVVQELPWDQCAQEGRVLHLKLKDFHFLNCYFTNGQQSQERLNFKMGFFEAFFHYAQKLRASKPVIICGDFNIAH